MLQSLALFAFFLSPFNATQPAKPSHAPLPVKIQPLVGNFANYTVKKGETLYQIARAHNVSKWTLAQLNHISPNGRRPKAGKVLVLPTMYIPPRNPGEGIVLNVPERGVYIFHGGQMKMRNPCAVGQADWQTALGAYHLEQKEKNPKWHPTPTMIERENMTIFEVASGPGNPLGDRWMGWSLGGYGFHSTNRPASVGSVASHGCVRLYPEAAHAMYETVKVGMPILSVYQPITLGKRDGNVYISVFSDIYSKGMVSGDRARAMLKQCGLLTLVDEGRLGELVADADGYPQRLIGSDQKIMVNNQPVTLPATPTYANGRWLVPAEAVAQAMGGQVSKTPGGEVSITNGRHTLVIRPAIAEVMFDTQRKPLPVGSGVDGVVYVPLRSLLGLFNAQVSEPTKGTLNVTTQSQK